MLVAFDVSRLFLGPLSATPRGVDRVDYLLARHFFTDPSSPNLGVLPTPWGIRAFPAHRVIRGLDYVADLWGESGTRDDRALLAWLKGRLSGADNGPNPVGACKLSLGAKMARMAGLVRATGFAIGKPVATALPRSAIYLNIGQIGLAVPAFYRWLDRRPDVAAAMMLHDVIPLDQPDTVDPSSVAHHLRMVRTVARHASALITTTAHANRQILAALAEMGRPRLPVFNRPLPLDDAFRAAPDLPAWLRDSDYFVICSTVEPRKNHAMLFSIWRQLVARLGDRAPHLLVIGGRGYDAERILAPIDDASLKGRVHHVSGMSTRTLVTVMRGARALLSPSRAEGFGLPVLEARALGIPVIASDIDAHREVGGGDICLLDPDDEKGWLDAVEARELAPRDANSVRSSRIFDSTAYCAELEDFLLECALGRRQATASQSHADVRHNQPNLARAAMTGTDQGGLDSNTSADGRSAGEQQHSGARGAAGTGRAGETASGVVDA